MRLAVLAVAGALTVAGDWATATPTSNGLALRLHYLMTCGRPGAGPLVVTLPPGFRITSLRVTVRGTAQPASASGSTVTVQLPKPPQVTCMSITEGVLPVTLAGVHAHAGTYTVRARIRNHAFSARLRIR